MKHGTKCIKKINSISQLISVFGPLPCKYSTLYTHQNLQKSKASLQAQQSVDSSRASKGCRSYESDQVFPPYFPKYTSEVAIQWEQSWSHTEKSVFPTIQIPDDTPNLNTGNTSHSFMLQEVKNYESIWDETLN